MALNWNEDVATALGQAGGFLKSGQRATSGALMSALASGDQTKAAELNRVRSLIESGQMTQDQLADYLVDMEINNQKADPSYGSLAKAPYKSYEAYAEPAPTFKKFSMSDYVADPGYKFRLDEGQKAIDRAGAARGNFYSGGALKEAADFGSNMASQEYGAAYDRHNNDFTMASGDWLNKANMHNTNFGIGYNQAAGDSDRQFNRLSSMIGTGAGMTNTGVNNNQNNANALGNIYGQVGNAAAGAALSKGNIFSNMVSGSQYSGLPWQRAGYTNPATGRSY